MNRLLIGVVAAAAIWAGACGGGGGTITPPPPMGKFTNASLNGTYAFVTSGEAFSNGATSATPFTRTGSFSANGSGAIQGGVYDVVQIGGSTVSAIPITGGTYSVSADGRGTITFNVTSNGAPTTINFSIVLTSGSSGPPAIASGGLMMDETANGNQASTGSGNFILQNSADFASGVSGTYVFDFTGADTGMSPESLVGRFAASGGVITAGIEDANDAATLTSGGITGSFTPDPTFNATSGRGTAVIANQNYVFYVVDSNRVRFISNNNATAGLGPMLTGDAVLQASVPASPSGSFVFLVSGASANGGLTRVGRFTVSGTTVSKILLDENDATTENEFNTFTSTTPSINYDTTTGRGVVSFSASSIRAYSFVFYLSSSATGVIQDVSPSDSTTPTNQVADGSIAAQAAGPFSGSNITGPYAMNWSGLVTANGSISSTDEEDFLSQVNVSSLNLSGAGDIFQFTGLTLTTNFGTGGSINFNGGDGTGDDGKAVDMTVIVGQPHVDMVVYIVSPQLAFFANRDNNGTQRIVAGVMQAQQ